MQKHLRIVLQTLREHRLYAKLSKCQFLVRQCRLFGTHSFCRGDLSGSAEGRSYIELETPTSVIEIRSFLGLAGHYRKFVEGFSKIAAPLTRLTRK